MGSRFLLCALSLAFIPTPAIPEVRERAKGAELSEPPRQLPSQVNPPIRISSNLVQVPVSVTDAAGQPVLGMRVQDFVVQEDGTPVPIAHMGEPGQTRLDVVLLFDVSGSVFARFDFEQQAATAFLKTIFRPSDTVAILGIATKPEVVLQPTSSLADSLAGLARLKPSGASTAFYDSLIASAHLLAGSTDPDTRRVQIILSDGEDNISELQLADALREVQRADCLFYSINPGGPSIRLNKVSLRGQQGMEELAAQTGGFAFLAEKLQDLEAIYGRIAVELQSQYLLTYYSPDAKADGTFRRISVRVPGKPELRIRSRQGYYPARSPSRR